MKIEQLLEETLVLITTDPDMKSPSSPDYVYADQGSNFAIHHDLSFPDATSPGLFVGLGPLALSYVVQDGGSGYFRRRAAEPYLASGKLRIVASAPNFPYPIYAVSSAAVEETLVRRAPNGLREVATLDGQPW